MGSFRVRVERDLTPAESDFLPGVEAFFERSHSQPHSPGVKHAAARRRPEPSYGMRRVMSSKRQMP